MAMKDFNQRVSLFDKEFKPAGEFRDTTSNPKIDFDAALMEWHKPPHQTYLYGVRWGIDKPAGGIFQID